MSDFSNITDILTSWSAECRVLFEVLLDTFGGESIKRRIRQRAF